MLRYGRHIWDALFTPRDAQQSLPRWLIPPVRFGYLVIQEFSRNRCPEKASALGFQTVFSLIPALALALFLFHAFGDFQHSLGAQVQQRLFHWLSIDRIYAPRADASGEMAEGDTPPDDATPHEQFTPIRLDAKVQEWIDNVYDELSSGKLSIISFMLLAVTALQLALTLDKSLNEVWGSRGQRNMLRRAALYWSVLTLGPLLIGASIYGANTIGVNSSLQDLAVRAAGPLVALFLIYKLVPSAPVHAAAAAIGAFTAAVLIQAARVLFAMYLRHAVTYNLLYGAIGVLPIFLFWLWIIWMIVLIGAEIAYTLQNLGRLAAEERRRRGAPFIQPGLVALGLVLHASRAFSSGKGAVEADELAESTGLPNQLWLRIVTLLRDRGILVEAGPDGSRFIPGRPLDALKVEDIFTVVEDTLVARPDEEWHPEQEQLRSVNQLIARARQRELGTTSIADLLQLEAAKPAGSAKAAS